MKKLSLKHWILIYTFICIAFYGFKAYVTQSLAIYQQRAIENHTTTDKEIAKEHPLLIKFFTP